MSSAPSQPTQTLSPGAKRVLIVGGSTRAAAWSAVRAGYQPVCADLFADLDTRQIAEIVPVRDYPDSLPDDVAEIRSDGWFYTGALENRPDLIEKLESPGASYGPLWGTSAAALRRIRDPFWLAETLQRAGGPAVAVRRSVDLPPADGTWLRKPMASAGGRAITVWTGEPQIVDEVEPAYFQRRCPGQSLSALFCPKHDGVKFLGLTEQLIAATGSQAPGSFSYCGSIGPWCGANPGLVRQLELQAELLMIKAGLRGPFGIDFLLDRGTAWIVEVNPRYTASVETLELSACQSLLAADPVPDSALRQTRFVAKQILYAEDSVRAPDLRIHRNLSPWDVPIVADIPVPGSQIQAAWPICTVLADGATREECVRRLADRVDTVSKMVNHRASDPAGPSEK
ncbi:MAG: ATP-grasp domain-containing protein [Planctomycetes bacterium]|nr:ATP-grasp domain-containing protein [Planctomycetota bacterium]